MGQRVTLAMNGKLTMTLDGSPTSRPLEVDIQGLQLDLDYLMANDHLQHRDDGRVGITLEGVTLTLALDAEEIISRGFDSIMAGIEEEIG